MQVEQGQHLADLRGLAAPGRQNRRGEPLALPGRLVVALVVHQRGPDLDRPGGRGDGPGLVVAVAHDHAATIAVPLISQLGYVAVDFRFQRGGQHPPGALADDLVDQGTVSIDYREHGRAFPTDEPTSAYSMTITGSFGKVRPSRVPDTDPQVLSIARELVGILSNRSRHTSRVRLPRYVERRRGP